MPLVRVLAGVTLSLLVSTAVSASPAAIETSLSKAKTWLYSQQKNGHWETAPAAAPVTASLTSWRDPAAGNYTGRTALAVLALLNSGEKANDDRLKLAIEFLQKTPTKGVYALGVRCQVWQALPPSPATQQAMRADAKLLLSGFQQGGNAKGMYDYVVNSPNAKTYSHSRSQYAVLGAWAAAQMGAEVPDTYWKTVEDAWKRNQDPAGGWRYTHPADNRWNTDITPGMTTVGIASLFITQEYLRPGDGLGCSGNIVNQPIDRAMQWLTANADKFPGDAKYDRDFPFLTLYAYERIGAASGLRYIGGIDWFEQGAKWILSKQRADGSWPGFDAFESQHVNSCFAMLFLAKGRAPIVFSKLRYDDAATGKVANWNQRPRDLANLTNWAGRLLERQLAFQITTLDADLADIAEAPILYIAGSQPVNLSDAHKAKLKAYLEAGGMVLASADCGKPEFAVSIRKLGTEMFPAYEFQSVQEKDILYTDYYPRSKWKTKPQIETLANGVRKLFVLVPSADLGKAWQIQDHRSKPEQFEAAVNLLLYAVDRQGLRYRGDRNPYLTADATVKAKRTIPLARVRYAGTWDPEPGGWRRLDNLLLKTAGTSLEVKPVELGKDALAPHKIAHLTGVEALKLTDPQRGDVAKYVESGGTLIIDAAGGSADFASAVEAELGKLFPNNRLEPVPASHPMFSRDMAVDYRAYARKTIIGRATGPRLQAITIQDRLAVIYSREDLTTGLTGQPVDGIIGYTPETATTLMTAILNYASQPRN